MQCDICFSFSHQDIYIVYIFSAAVLLFHFAVSFVFAVGDNSIVFGCCVVVVVVVVVAAVCCRYCCFDKSCCDISNLFSLSN